MKPSKYNRRSKWERLCRRVVRWKSDRIGRELRFEVYKEILYGRERYFAVSEDERGKNAVLRGGRTRIDAVRKLIQVLLGTEKSRPSSSKASYRELVLEIESRGF